MDAAPGTSTLSVRLLGGFAVVVGARTVDDDVWRLRKACTLVKLLALEPDRRVHRDRLCRLWWPDRDGIATRRNLHQVVHAARRALGTVGIDQGVVLRRDLVVLAPGRQVLVDLEEFRRRAQEARGSTDLRLLEQALAAGAGELLPEDRDASWAQPHRDALRGLRTELALAAASASGGRGRHRHAVEILLPVLAEDELDEAVARALMRALAADGRRSEALAVFERVRDGIGREYGGVPDPRTRRLYRDLLAGSIDSPAEGLVASSVEGADRVSSPGSTDQRAGGKHCGPASGPHNLPTAVTALIGRAGELEETCALLDRTRILTVTGPGGAGKTRLATELARCRLGRHPDGVWLVQLAALSRGDLLAHQVAAALGLTLPERGAPQPALLRQLGGRRLLLVLDNCEHLVDPCAHLVHEVLRRCPGVVVLATSREPLRVEGEVAWRIPSLAVPGPGATARQLGRVAAVRLFVERARAVVPRFALTDDNAAAVARICVELDGMPLALELAAARLPTLGPAQIAERLDDALGLLAAGHRTAPDRQRTLRATVEWSYRLLDDVERQVFRQLGVFAGSIGLEALEAVCGREIAGPGGVRVPTLRVLAELVDKSLVSAETRAGATRYRLLTPIRKYAEEALAEAGEAGSARRRHLDWYGALAARRDGTPVTAELDAEDADLRSALAFALADDPPAALELAVSLWPHWLSRGRFLEGARWLEEALAAAPAPGSARGRGLFALAVFDVRCGRGERLGGLAAEQVAVRRGLPDPEPARALQLGGILAFMDGDWPEACARAEECLGLAAPSDGDAAAAVHLLALVALSQGRLGEARELLFRTTDLLRRATAPTRPFFWPVLLGVAVEPTADGPRTVFEETMLQARPVGAEPAANYVRCNLAWLARLEGDLDEAAGHLDAAVAGSAVARDLAGRGVALNQLGCLHRLRGEFGAGRAALREALRIREGLGDRRAVGLTTGNLGLLAAAAGDVAHGRDLIRLAATGFRETRDGPGTIGMLAALADIALDTGDFGEACRLLEHAVARASGGPGDHRWVCWMWLMLAHARRSLGRTAAAEDARRSAEELFARLGAVDGPAYCYRAAAR